MTKDKALGIIGMGIITLAVIMMGFAAWLAFVPVTVLQPQAQPYKVLTPIVKPGEAIVYQVDACKLIEAPATVIRRFIDETGTVSPLPPEQNNVKPGCLKTNVPVITPLLHPGKWYLTLDVTYQVNPLRTETYHLTTDTFIITKE